MKHVWIEANANQTWALAAKHALASGVVRHGDRVTMGPEQPADCDLSVAWAFQARQRAMAQRQWQAGRRHLVMEVAFVGPLLERTSLGFDGLCGLGEFPDPQDGGRRWRKVFREYYRPRWRRRMAGDAITIMGQVPGDAALDGVDLGSFYADAAARLRYHDLPLVFRPHPVAVERGIAGEVPNGIEVDLGPLDACLDRSRFVATYSSNTGVDAVLAGVPTWTLHRGSMAYDVTGHDLDVPPPRPSRSAWMAGLAYCQWSPTELHDGTAWEHLRPMVDQAPLALRKMASR